MSNNISKFGGKIWLDSHGSCSYQCALCSNTFFSAGYYEFHVLKVHSSALRSDVPRTTHNNEQIPRNSAKADNRNNHDKTYRKPKNQSRLFSRKFDDKSTLSYAKCTKQFDDLKQLRSHIRKCHHFDCSYCQDGFETEKGLWSHQRKQHATKFPYRCRVCPRAFKQYYQLKDHMPITHAQRNYVRCDFCSKMLMSKFEKLNHIKKEHSNRRYYCFLCTEYRTTNNDNLKRHTKEKHPGLSQPK